MVSMLCQRVFILPALNSLGSTYMFLTDFVLYRVSNHKICKNEFNKFA